MIEERTGRETARKQILSIARALLAGEIDVLHAAEQIAGYADSLDPKYQDPDLRTFGAISSETDHYLVIDSVAGWHPDDREAREAEYEAANNFYAEAATRAAKALLEKLAPPA